jgi:kinesin family protein 20
MRIPFRECKLTRLLSEYFTEDNKILMVVNVKLTKEDIEETLKVLHYGALSVNVNLLRSRIYD